MASYHGWDREELRVAGLEASEDANLTFPTQSYPAPSFTPVNHDRSRAQYISPLDMHLEKPIEALLDDHIPRAPAKQSKKRPAPVNPGRAHSIGTVWQFSDEGDVGYQSKEDQLPPKRRKSVPAKRSKSSNGLSHPLAQIPESFEEGSSGPQGEHNPQLTTPPDSTKRAKSKPGSKGKKPQLPAFKSLTVTKTAATNEKQPARPADDLTNSSSTLSPSTVKSQLGWTTTQEAVKLTKTTLDKLAAFRYRAPPQVETQPPAKNIAHKAGTHSAYTDPHQVGNVSAADATFASSGTYFGSTFWEPETNNFFSNELQAVNNGYLHMDQPSLSPIPQDVEEVHYGAIPSEPLAFLSTLECAQHYSAGTSQAKAQNPPAQPSSQYDDPTSSEVRAWNDFMNNSEVHTHIVSQPVDVYPTAITDPSVDKACDDPRKDLASEVEGTDNASSMQDHDEAIEYSDPRTPPQPVRNLSRVISKEFQVDQSDDVDFDKTYDMGKGYELDEFDEGLDDSDLLDLASGPVVPVTQISANSNPKGNGCQSASDSPTSAQLGELEGMIARPDETSPVIANPQSDPIQPPELDDEFPMDEADEELMLEVAQRITAVHETFETPESVLNALEDMEPGEVYDSSLQFSPPKTETSLLSPEKVAHYNLTDSNSSPQKLGQRSHMTGEEENWAFLRRQDIQPAASSDVEEDYQCFVVSPPPAVRKVSDFFKPQSTLEMVDSIKDILDDSHEYLPLKAFVRPEFPTLTADRCPIVGVSTQSFLRVCFRVGEMFKEGGRRNALGQDAVIELYAKVIFSTREPGSTKQLFQFGDLFHDKSPTANGVLMNYKTTGLADSESKIFLGQGQSKMARCLGRLKRDRKTASGWLLHVITIRETDWEEIRWTKRIVSAGVVKSEVPSLSKS